MRIFTTAGKDFLASVKTDLYNSLLMPLNKNAANEKPNTGPKNMRITCEHCGKIFKKATKLACEASLRMHVGRKHGNIRPGHQPEAPLSDDQKRQKRLAYSREWRRKHGRNKSASRNGAVEVCYCPKCGMNLQVLATALAIAKKV